MAKPVDAAIRQLLEGRPGDWLTLLGLIHGEDVQVVDSDLSTVTAEADKVFRVEGPLPWLAHIEAQTGRDLTLPRRLLRYHSLLHNRHGLPVHTVLLLLRRQADGPELDGRYRPPSPDGRCWLEFHYHVVRVWELDAPTLLAGGPGVLPLAPLAARSEAELPAILQDLSQRVAAGDTASTPADFWASTAILMGLRFPGELIARILKGVGIMEDNSFVQLMIQEGRLREVRRIVLDLGRIRLGPPEAETVAAIESLTDLDRVEELTRRVLEATTWAELLSGNEVVGGPSDHQNGP